MEHLMFSGHSVVVGLYRKVQNASLLRDRLLKGELMYAFIDAKTLMAPIQLFLAIHKAIHAMDHHQLMTKNVHSEIVYCLSPHSNVSWLYI
jgi:EKC/KEOPS complex subunit CGI121/TPRKB